MAAPETMPTEVDPNPSLTHFASDGSQMLNGSAAVEAAALTDPTGPSALSELSELGPHPAAARDASMTQKGACRMASGRWLGNVIVCTSSVEVVGRRPVVWRFETA